MRKSIHHFVDRKITHFAADKYPSNNVVFGLPCLYDLDARYNVNGGVVANLDTVTSWKSVIGGHELVNGWGTVRWNQNDANFNNFPSIQSTSQTATIANSIGAVPFGMNTTMMIVFRAISGTGGSPVFLTVDNQQPNVTGAVRVIMNGSLASITGQGIYITDGSNSRIPQSISTGSKDTSAHIIVITGKLCIRDAEVANPAVIPSGGLDFGFNSFGFNLNNNGMNAAVTRLCVFSKSLTEERIRTLIADVNNQYQVF
jgi:hypothetical protein